MVLWQTFGGKKKKSIELSAFPIKCTYLIAKIKIRLEAALNIVYFNYHFPHIKIGTIEALDFMLVLF